MIIRPYLHYEENEILPLYKAVGWCSYYQKPGMLRSAYENSLSIMAAYEEDLLVGVIRSVGDGHSILFIQDILVCPEYQRKGIGTALMKAMLKEYPNVYQTELITDHTEKTIAFYKSLGFVPLEEIRCRGFIKIR